MSTGDSIIPLPLWFDETPQPPSTIHDDVLPPVPSFDETPFLTAPFREAPTIPSVARRWRSRTFHLDNLVLKRWRSDTVHPETLVPTTTPPQLRWRAGVLRALGPFRRLRDTHSDPSERVKRSRLAPTPVMTTTVAKHCDWSLDFEERGPVFDGAQDWRTRFFSLDVRQGKKSILLPNLQRISVCCLRPWNVNGRKVKNSMQHCH